jgi:hypothetical protein
MRPREALGLAAVIATMLLVRLWFPQTGIPLPSALVFLLVGWAIDVFSLGVELRRNRRGVGPTGVPVIGACLAGYAVLLSERALPFDFAPSVLSRMVDLAVVAAIHETCQSYVPRWHRRWTRLI